LCVKRPVIRRQTSSYLTSNAKRVLSRPNARVVQVSMHLLWVKRPVIRRQTSRYLTPNAQIALPTLKIRVVPSYWPSNVQLSHAKCPDSIAEAQNTCSAGEYEFIVGQTPSYWPNARVVQVRKGISPGIAPGAAAP